MALSVFNALFVRQRKMLAKPTRGTRWARLKKDDLDSYAFQEGELHSFSSLRHISMLTKDVFQRFDEAWQSTLGDSLLSLKTQPNFCPPVAQNGKVDTTFIH